MIWTIKRTNQFKKNYKILPKYLKDKFKYNFEKFLENQYDVSLKTHKLKWKFSDCFSSSINDDYRFITKIYQNNNIIVLVNIWNHSIYR